MQELRSQKEPRGAARLRPAHTTQRCHPSWSFPQQQHQPQATSTHLPGPFQVNNQATRTRGGRAGPITATGPTSNPGRQRGGLRPTSSQTLNPFVLHPSDTEVLCISLAQNDNGDAGSPHHTKSRRGRRRKPPPAARHHPRQLHPYLFDLPTPRAREDDGLAPVVVGGHRGHPVLLVHEQRRPLDGDGPAQRLVKILPAEIVVDLQGLREGKGER